MTFNSEDKIYIEDIFTEVSDINKGMVIDYKVSQIWLTWESLDYGQNCRFDDVDLDKLLVSPIIRLKDKYDCVINYKIDRPQSSAGTYAFRIKITFQR